MSDVYREQAIYTDGYKIGYAQAVADADAALRKHGDSFTIRWCRRDVLALANVPYDPQHAIPVPDWSKHSVSGPAPHSPPLDRDERTYVESQASIKEASGK